MLPPSAKPYLLRAIYEWCLEENHTPHLVASVAYPGIQIPSGYSQEGRVTLNIAPRATHGLVMTNDWISFMARFGGRPMKVEVPVAAVAAIFAAETQEGLVFDLTPPTDTPPTAPQDEEGTPPPRRPGLRVVK